jgi:cobalt-zinc-cadmium resistance protein CzcA
MFERIIRFAIAQRWLVLLAVAAWPPRRLQLPEAAHRRRARHHQRAGADQHGGAGYSPLETEQRITFPLENVMAGLPRLEQTRSLSRYGLSQVTVVFKDGTDIYFARQLVNERCRRRAQAAGRDHAGDGPDLHRPGRDLPVDRGGQAGARKPTARPTRRPTCARSRTGSSSRSCATCPASPRSTPSAATPRSTTWRRSRSGWPPTA